MASAPPPDYQEKGGPLPDTTQPLLQGHPSSDGNGVGLPTAPPPYPAGGDTQGYGAESGAPYPPQSGPGYPQEHHTQSAYNPMGQPGYPAQGHPGDLPYGQPGYPPPGQPGYPPPGQPGYPPPGQPGYPPQGKSGYPPPGQPGYPPPGQPGYLPPGQPVAVSYVAGQQAVIAQPGEQAPNDYLCFSIFNILCCCCCLGIVALMKSLSVKRLFDNRQYNEARQASAEALRWNKISLGIGIVILICWIAAVVALNILGSSLFSSVYEFNYN